MSEARVTKDTLLIWGTGAIGGTIGAYLARAGVDVLLVDTDAGHVAAMQANGLVIEGPIEAFTVPVRAVTPDQVLGQFGRILLSVKAHHTDAATRALQPHLAPGGYVASFQNGLNELVIGDIIGAENVVGAFVNFGADYLAPGRILYGGRGACVIGEVDGRVTPRVTALRDLLTTFEPGAVATGDIMGYLWGKLGYGALLFATALTDDSIADVLDDKTYRQVLTATAREAIAVALARGVTPRGFNGFDPAAFAPDGGDAAVAASMDAMVAFNRRSAKSHSGIWRDLAVRKRRTEVDAQLGPIVTQGQQAGIQTPVMRKLIELIHGIENGRPLASENLAELAGALGAA